MTERSTSRTLSTFGLLLAIAATSEALPVRLPSGDNLTLTVPDEWQTAYSSSGPGLTVRLSQGGGGDSVMLMTVIPVRAGSPASTLPGLRAIVEEMGRRALATAVQDRFEISEIVGSQGTALLFHVTDRDAEKGPGDYREMDQGAMLIGNYVASITVLTHTGDEATIARAKAVIASTTIDTDQAPSASASELTKLAVPGRGWSIAFRSPPLSGREESTDGGDYAFRANAGRFNVSLFVEQPGGGGSDHETCFRYYWARASRNPLIDASTIKAVPGPTFVRVEYMLTVPAANGVVRDKNVNYYFEYRGRWVDVHISIADPRAEDDAIFAAFDQSLRYGE